MLEGKFKILISMFGPVDVDFLALNFKKTSGLFRRPDFHMYRTLLYIFHHSDLDLVYFRLLLYLHFSFIFLGGVLAFDSFVSEMRFSLTDSTQCFFF